jgi:hypothetical protein
MVSTTEVKGEGGNALPKWTLGHAPTTLARRERAPHETARMRHVVAVPTKARLAAVEDGGRGQVGVLAPVPVRLGACEAAFCLERCFVRPV